jgi:hypothetical protein
MDTGLLSDPVEVHFLSSLFYILFLCKDGLIFLKIHKEQGISNNSTGQHFKKLEKFQLLIINLIKL